MQREREREERDVAMAAVDVRSLSIRGFEVTVEPFSYMQSSIGNLLLRDRTVKQLPTESFHAVSANTHAICWI